MYEDLIIRNVDGVWKLVSDQGYYPIKIAHPGNGWTVTNIYSGGNPQKWDDWDEDGNDYPGVSYDIEFGINGKAHLMNVDETSGRINCVKVDDIDINEFTLGCNYPITDLMFIEVGRELVPVKQRTRHRVD